MLAAGTHDAAITDSGSTNAAGFTIKVSPLGEAVFTPKPRRAGQLPEAELKPRTLRIPAALVKRFFAALDAETPLSNVPTGRCMKSASFGTTRTIEYHDQKTPDLSCGDHGDAKLRALIESMSDIVKLFRSH